MSGGRAPRRCLEIDCRVDVEHSARSLHAHVELAGCDVEAGDTVQVRGALAAPEFGEQRSFRAKATIERAGWLRRRWIRASSILHLTSLYDVSFSNRRTP